MCCCRGDALFQLLLLEWHAAYDGVQRPSLRPNAEVLVAGPHLYPPLQCGAGAADMRTRNEQASFAAVVIGQCCLYVTQPRVTLGPSKGQRTCYDRAIAKAA